MDDFEYRTLMKIIDLHTNKGSIEAEDFKKDIKDLYEPMSQALEFIGIGFKG